MAKYQNRPGKLIVFEGCDRCGKSTHAAALSKYLTSQGIRNHLSHEPTEESIYGELVKSTPNLSNLERTLLILKDRQLHVDRIKPLLDQGIQVILDRFYWSSLAYNATEPITEQLIIENTVENALIPDLVFYLHRQFVEGLTATANTADNLAMTFENSAVQTKVAKRYQHILAGNTMIDVLEIDTDQSYLDCHQAILTKVNSLLNNSLEVA